MNRRLTQWLLGVSAGLLATLLSSGIAAANPRGGWTRGAGDASWDSRFDWNTGGSNPRGGWTRGGGDASWDSRFDWNDRNSGNPRGGWTRGAGDASWDSRFDWNN